MIAASQILAMSKAYFVGDDVTARGALRNARADETRPSLRQPRLPMPRHDGGISADA